MSNALISDSKMEKKKKSNQICSSRGGMGNLKINSSCFQLFYGTKELKKLLVLWM